VAHVAPEPPTRRRFDIAVGVALAVVGVAVAIVAVIALRNPQGREAGKVIESSSSSSASSATPSKSPSRAPTAKASSAPPTSSRVPSSSAAVARPALVVLDNSGKPSLAEVAKAQFVAGGWHVSSTGELVNDIVSTAAYYDPSYPGAQQAAMALQEQFPEIRRVVPRFAELPAGPIVVVLTSDFSG
jgi:LytR cell envelope-related transcriptional attenuator